MGATQDTHNIMANVWYLAKIMFITNHSLHSVQFSGHFCTSSSARKFFFQDIEQRWGGVQIQVTGFPGIREAKIQEGISVGPQIMEPMNDIHFDKLLNGCIKHFHLWMSLKLHFLHSNLEFF